MLWWLRWTLTALSLFAAVTPSWALDRRPTISTAASCMTDYVLDRADWDCDGSICACCYTDGCWICGANATLGSGFGDCVWEQGFRPGAQVPFGGTDGVLDPDAGNSGMTLQQVGPPATQLEQ